ncbi:three-Cys-motif partner protein TcmP [uncultured Brachyspira sp.]|uniref:three-Cys-motif partner protein TcmP n=1 Tax=uncultured Brachyspira sp. TaxID=221953 RepID=UPI0026202AAC|nr:three-Cys-motif partner protein TcmP [uncultured Brachyspira sp.]
MRCVGNWAYKKVYYITRYFDIFFNGMKNKFFNLNYLEICSGPGRCIYKNEGTEYDGTALSILHHSSYKHANSILFFDKEEEVVNILNNRIMKLGKQDKSKAFIADYYKYDDIINIISHNMVKENSLNLLVIDPTDCSVPFETIKNIKKYLGKVDLIINFAYGTDLKRNIVKFVNGELTTARDKYIKFLGDDDFLNNKDVKRYAEHNNNDKLLELYFNYYREHLKQIGFTYIDPSVSVKHFYSLLFASANKRGFDFWKKIKEIESSGQRTLDLF